MTWQQIFVAAYCGFSVTFQLIMLGGKPNGREGFTRCIAIAVAITLAYALYSSQFWN